MITQKKKKQVIYDDKIFIETDKGYISYDYRKFKNECIPGLTPFFYYKMMLKNIQKTEKKNAMNIM